MKMRKLKKYKPTKFKAKDSVYDKDAADFAVNFIQCLCHTKGTWAGKPFELIDWQEQIIRDLFGILKPNGYRQFNTAYIEIPKKQGKSELAAAVALLLTCGVLLCAAEPVMLYAAPQAQGTGDALSPENAAAFRDPAGACGD